MTELSAEVHAEVQRLCAEGDALAKAGEWSDAIALYWNAWDRLPEPRTEWEAATWILAAVGDANFLSGDYAAGMENLAYAMRCPSALGNPFIHLRLGQCQFELGAHDKAADELMRAYMGAGADIFKSENPKYLAFVSGRAKNVPEPKKSWELWK